MRRAGVSRPGTDVRRLEGYSHATGSIVEIVLTRYLSKGLLPQQRYGGLNCGWVNREELCAELGAPVSHPGQTWCFEDGKSKFFIPSVRMFGSVPELGCP